MNSEPNSITDNADKEAGGFETVPAVSVLYGQPVIMKDREYVTQKDKDGKEMVISDIIDELKGQYEKVLITDLNGITRDRPQLEILKGICSKMSLWVDAGSRYGEGAIDILITEADKVVLATKTLRKLEELGNALELSENIILGLDYDEGIVSPNKDIRDMTPLTLVKEAEDIGIDTYIFTDMKNLTSETHFAMDAARTLLSSERKVYIHGRFESGTGRLEGLGLTGAVIEVEDLL
jgi:uncharacterized protein related to proFAR isomerase